MAASLLLSASAVVAFKPEIQMFNENHNKDETMSDEQDTVPSVNCWEKESKTATQGSKARQIIVY